jgi:hypothetical protein
MAGTGEGIRGTGPEGSSCSQAREFRVSDFHRRSCLICFCCAGVLVGVVMLSLEIHVLVI